MEPPLSSFERNATQADALHRAKAFLDEAGLAFRYEILGSPVPSIRCVLTADHIDVGSGLGKGLGEQAFASAIFEAIEHYVWFRSLPPTNTRPTSLDLAGADISLKDCSPDFELVCGSSDVKFTRVRMIPVGGLCSEIDYPFFLTNPYWSPSSSCEQESINRFALKRYSTNSGTASGVTQDEAILHGLLEAIERDAIGVELLRVVVSKSPAPVRYTLAQELYKDFFGITANLDRDDISFVGAWDFTANDIGIPVALVGVSDRTNGRVSYGTGASLLAEYAFERALLEAVQTVHALRTLPDLKPYRAPRADAPAFIRCALDRGHFGFLGGSQIAEPRSFIEPTVVMELTPREQIDAIAERLSVLDMPVYRRTLSTGIVSVEQVMVPKFERFHVVTSGVPVAPSARGRRMMRIVQDDAY